MKTYAIIPSAGRGKRSGISVPKQYALFNSKELIVYTLEVFQKCDLIDEIIIAAEREYFELLNNLKEKYKLSKITRIVKGGEERQNSVFNALSSINCKDDDLVAVHDAARPLLPPEILEKAINSAKEFDNVVVALKARDTLFEGDEIVSHYLERNKIYYAQTPQIFRYKVLKDSLDKANEQNFIGTDESMIVKNAGHSVTIVEGSSINLKITTADDCTIFERISQNIEK